MKAPSLLFALLLAGDPWVSAEDSFANVTFVNASGWPQPLSAAIGRDLLGSSFGLPPGESDGPYTFQADAYTVKVQAGDEEALVSKSITLEAGHSLILIATGGHPKELPDLAKVEYFGTTKLRGRDGETGGNLSGDQGDVPYPDQGEVPYPDQGEGSQATGAGGVPVEVERTEVELHVLKTSEFERETGKPVLFMLSFLDPEKATFAFGKDQGPWSYAKPVVVKDWVIDKMEAVSPQGWTAQLEWEEERIDSLMHQVMVIYRGTVGVPEAARVVLLD